MSPSQVPWTPGVSWGTWLHVTLSHLSHYTRFVSPFLGGLKTTEVKNKLALTPFPSCTATRPHRYNAMHLNWFQVISVKKLLVPTDYRGMSWMVYQVVVFFRSKDRVAKCQVLYMEKALKLALIPWKVPISSAFAHFFLPDPWYSATLSRDLGMMEYHLTDGSSK